MPLETDYATTEQLRAFMRVQDSDDDAQMALAITAASRAIDVETGRKFGNAEAVMTFEVLDGGCAIVTDVARIDSVTLNGQTVDPRPWPLNAAALGRPYERLLFDSTARGEVEVTGLFGWLEVPEAVTQACLMQASRLMARRDSPYGVAGSPDTGGELRLLAKVDPDVSVILSGYRRRWGAA